MSPPRSRCWAAALVTLGLACATRAAPVPTKPAAPVKPAVQPTATNKTPTDDELCQLDGYDFAYGFDEYNDARMLQCGVGPGTRCRSGVNHCEGTRYMSCVGDRLNMMDCRDWCRESGDEQGITYDGGSCVAKDGDVMCACCDVGQPGCEKETPQPKAHRAGPLAPPLPRGRR